MHPISLALRFLKGHRTTRTAPYYGRPLFASDDEAVAVLRRFTGRDFGTNAIAWGNWLGRNRWVSHANAGDPRLSAPDCSRCSGRGKVQECLKGRGKVVWRRIKCPVCQGRGIVVERPAEPGGMLPTSPRE
jgi:hypothetical protein